MTIPTMAPVQSSFLDAVGHDGSHLYIRFKPGKDGVSPLFRYELGRDAHDALVAAESVGKHYHAHIHKAVRGERVE